MPVNPAAVQAAWTAAKAHLATLQANLATVQANLATLEADCDTLYSQGAGDVVDWLRTNAKTDSPGISTPRERRREHRAASALRLGSTTGSTRSVER